jgi:hypothetical protein
MGYTRENPAPCPKCGRPMRLTRETVDDFWWCPEEDLLFDLDGRTPVPEERYV